MYHHDTFIKKKTNSDTSGEWESYWTLVLTCSEGCRDTRPHHRSKQHIEREHILSVMGHILQLVLCSAAVQSQLPGTVPTNKLWEQHEEHGYITTWFIPAVLVLVSTLAQHQSSTSQENNTLLFPPTFYISSKRGPVLPVTSCRQTGRLDVTSVKEVAFQKLLLVWHCHWKKAWERTKAKSYTQHLKVHHWAL